MATDGQRSTINLMGLELPWRPTLAVILSTLLITIDYYHTPGGWLSGAGFSGWVRGRTIESVVLFGLIPLLVIVLIFRERPANYGLALGDWRAGLRWTAVGWAGAAVILVFAARTPGMVAYYLPYRQLGAGGLLSALVYLLGWEFLFRGFLLWALFRVAGPSAVLLQAVPFALAHLGKPPLETMSTIFGGLAFGWVAWRTRSFIYPVLIHWFVMCFTVAASGW